MQQHQAADRHEASASQADEIIARVLHTLSLVDSPPEPGFNRFTRLACRVTSAPMALVTFVEERANRQFFKASQGLPPTLRQTDLDRSFCKFVTRSGQTLSVPDARTDPRFMDNPVIAETGVIAYLGAPIYGPSGETIGSLCALDRKPRDWSDAQERSVSDLADCVSDHIALRQKMTD